MKYHNYFLFFRLQKKTNEILFVTRSEIGLNFVIVWVTSFKK